MDTVIKQISEVESAASAIMDHANAQKTIIAQEMAEKTASFDRQIDIETEEKIAGLRSRMEIEMNKKLAHQKELAASILAAMEQNYKEQHIAYVDKLLLALTEG